MTIDQADFDVIAEQDLQQLVDARAPESLRLDFKLTHYGRSDSEKLELLKDISALANSHGGHLVLGVEETEGTATRLIGIDTDVDAEILRMEQIARNGLEPPVPGIRIRAIPLSTGRKVLLVRVPRSWNPPHRVTAKRANRFYIRHSAGVTEPSIEELRALFNQSSTALDRARRFRDERIHFVRRDEGPRPLEGGGRLFLHIVPTAAFSGMVHLDVEQIHATHKAFWPIGASGTTARFNYYGFINERGGDKNHGYTQVFRNGALEATKAGIMRQYEGRLAIAGLALERSIFERFSSYIMGLRDVGVPPPLIIMFTFDGVKGARYAVERDRWEDYWSPLPESTLALPECVIDDYRTEMDHHRAVRPAFDALWNAIGYSRSQFFNETGLWVGERKGR
ncbi:MAG: ATP-binding protein [Thermodesulfobacteriota bacterium]